jgi:quinol monooxygenase YgiN
MPPGTSAFQTLTDAIRHQCLPTRQRITRSRTMPALPWTIPNPAPPGTQACAMASRFAVRSAKDVPRFFLKSLAAWRQVRSAPGCLGASLLAQPLRRVFYTLSAWENRDTLYAFAATRPHRDIMASLRPTMRSATFTFWDVPAGQLPLTWDDAQRRLAGQAQADSTSTGRTPRQT